MRRIFAADGRSVIVACDHAGYMGQGPPHGPAMASIVSGGPDAVLATLGLARSCPDILARCGVILRVDGGFSDLGEPPKGDVTDLLHGAELALRLGADAVAVMAFPGDPDERVSILRLATLASECELLGLPVMAEVLPGGFSRALPWSVENVARGARIAAELGADIVKTVAPEDPADFRTVVDACPVPVVALGGPPMPSEDAVVTVASGVVAAGAAGIAFGRNVWGSPDPAGLVARLVAAVHHTT